MYYYEFHGSPCPHFRRVETSVACFWRKLPLALTPNPRRRRETQGLWWSDPSLHCSPWPTRKMAIGCLGDSWGKRLVALALGVLSSHGLLAPGNGMEVPPRQPRARRRLRSKTSSAERGLRQFVGGDVALP